MNSSYVNAKKANLSYFIKIAFLSHLKIVHALATGPCSALESTSAIEPSPYRLWVVAGKSFWRVLGPLLVVSSSSTVFWPRPWWKVLCRAHKAKKTTSPEHWAEPAVPSAESFSSEREEGPAVNIGLALGWNAVEHHPAAQRQWRS